MSHRPAQDLPISDLPPTPRRPSNIKVYYALPIDGEEEISAVVRSLRDPLSLVHGPCTSRMEQEVAKLFGKSSGVMVNSASSANMLAVAIFELLNKKGLPSAQEKIAPADPQPGKD